MDYSSLNEDFFNYLIENQGTSASQMALKKSPFQEISSRFIAQQIFGKKISKKKLPEFYNHSKVLYPPKINLEQCSSEFTAKYKASLFETSHSFCDLSGGFGIDTYFISKKFEKSIHVDPNTELQNLVKYNFESLKNKNTTFINTTCEDFLKNTSEKFDALFVDPSRRDQNQKKVFLLEDLSPNMVELQSLCFEKSTRILTKLSPLFDIQKTINDLDFIKEIHIVSYKNEVKELLVLQEKDFLGTPTIGCVELSNNNYFSFQIEQEKNADFKLSTPKKYIYQPNVSILKAGAFKLFASHFGVQKLASDTHLYTSEELVSDVFGKTFEVIQEIKNIKKELPSKIIHVISKNYPLNTHQLKQKHRLKDGGELYLMAFSSEKKKHLLLCKKV